MVIYSTKRFLRDGIVEYRDANKLDFDRVSVRLPNGWLEVLLRGEWHETMAAAVDAAHKIRDKRIAELERQIAKLKLMVIA